MCNGYRLLEDTRIKEELARRITHKVGITKEFVHSNQLTIIEYAKTHDNYDLFERANMDAAKLAGLLIEKRADVTEHPVLTEPQLTAELHRRGLSPVPVN